MPHRSHQSQLQHLAQREAELGREIPDTLDAFRALRHAALSAGALAAAHKELIALGIAIAARCGGGVSTHVQGSLAAGASAPEIREAIGVAVLMGGEPALTFGLKAVDALEDLSPDVAASSEARA